MPDDALRLLSTLIDEKARRGEQLTVTEARYDTRAQGLSQRERAARWGWTHANVRTFDAGGEPDLEGRFAPRAHTEVAQGNTEVTQETAPIAQNGAEVAQRQHRGNTAESAPAPYPKEITPPPTGAAPRGRARSVRRTFEPPTEAEAEAEIRRYAERKRRPDWLAAAAALAEEFIGHYTTNGWVQGKRGVPVKDWRTAAQGWCRRSDKYGLPGTDGTNGATKAGTPTGFLGDPRAEMTAAEAAELVKHYPALTSADFYRCGANWKGEKLWRCKIESLIAVGAVNADEVAA